MERLRLAGLDRYRDWGLLVLRAGIGLMFIGHGLPKLLGGAEKWEAVGSAMGRLGLESGYQTWGLLAALAETGGGAFLMLGLLARLACIPLLFTMIIAATRHLVDGDELFRGASHAVESGVVFAALLILGPGRYSLDELLFRRGGGGAIRRR